MLKNLKMLLSLRAWLRSGSLKAGGLIGLIGALQTWLASGDGMTALDWVAGILGLTAQTTSGIVMGLIGLVMLALRAKTEWSLGEKVEGIDKASP